jgi:hypothetical protein
VVVGLVDQGSRGGGGKKWQRGRPSGGGGSGGSVSGSGAGGGVDGGCVDGSGGGVDGSGGGVNGSGGGVDGGSGRPVSASCGLASVVGQRWWIIVDTVNILATFGYLAAFLAFVYLLVSQKETNIFGLLFMLQIKKTNTQIKKWSFCMRIHVLVQRNHLFGKTNTQKMVAKVKNLRTEEKLSFVYLGHSLSMYVTPKTISCQNQKTNTTPQLFCTLST